MSLITSSSVLTVTIPHEFLMTDVWESGINESDVTINNGNTRIRFNNQYLEIGHWSAVSRLIDVAFRKNRENKMLKRLKSDIAQKLANLQY